MASDNSFDVVSKVEIQEVKNAIDQASKEVHARFDLKDSKKKAQASIQGDTVRVVSKDRDTLQEIMALLRGKDIGVELQFTNFRSN